ncbi:MAG: glycosyltransferase family 39 protein [Sedimentisphaerales bacterium]|nr:glycosyltransferase family 39 protein [Sedimentisphaerales bacterium]
MIFGRIIQSISKSRWAILAIVLLGLCFRLYGLASESLWLDEGLSVQTARHHDIATVLDHVYEMSANPPGHYIALHYWIRLFGTSEFSVRLLSAICSTICIGLTYLIGRRLLGHRSALLAALLVSLSKYELYFAQEARTYALWSMFTLLSMYFFLRLLEKRSLWFYLAYLLSSAVMLYCHPYAPLIIVAQNVFVLLWWILVPGPKFLLPIHWIPLQLLVVASYSFWMRQILHRINQIQQTGLVLLTPSIWDLPGVAKAFAGDSTVFGLLFLLLAIFALFWARQKGSYESAVSLRFLGRLGEPLNVQRTFALMFLAVWILVLILIPWFVSQVSTPIFSSRYMIACSIAFFLLVSHGILMIPWPKLRVTIAAVSIASCLITTLPTYWQVNKEQWRQVATYIETNAQSGDLLLFYAYYCRPNIYAYYSTRTDLNMAGFLEQANHHDVNDQSLQQLQEITAGYERVWLILSHARNTEGPILETLLNWFTVVDHQPYYDVEIYEFKRLPPKASQ